MAKRRELTDQEKRWADNLKRIWLLKKKSLGLTQEKASELMGFKGQSAFWQYMNARIPLNTDAKIKAAKVLQVSVTDIDPEFEIPTTNGAWQEVSATFTAQERMDAMAFILFH